MKMNGFRTILAVLLLSTIAIPGFASSDQDQDSPGDDQSSTMSHNQHGMMNMSGMMGQRHENHQKEASCIKDTDHEMMGSGHNMMGMMGMDSDMRGSGHGMMDMMGMGSGMMSQRMDHMFFLDQAEELGLTANQISRLKTIHSACRTDNIRNMAEAKIARLDLKDLLASENWTMKDAEALVRKVEKLDGDRQVRQLQAKTDARKVLTAEQLEKARTSQDSGNLEGLFD